ncbi:MAG: PEP-CTERM sorting domain-containing protein [Acidihalobacter sp.]|uniref:PEP-CTERM sorting domain-containing protein n=1 Tax=Acidihalobacter sp. TaxID=1872108 RepID=UPI00307CEFEA
MIRATKVKAVLGGTMLVAGLAFASAASANVFTYVTPGGTIEADVGSNTSGYTPITTTSVPLSGYFNFSEWLSTGNGNSFGYLNGGLSATNQNADYCVTSGCQLTFQVTGLVPTGGSTTIDGTSYSTYTPGAMNIYVNDGSFNQNSPTFAAAGQGTLMWSLAINDFMATPITQTGQNFTFKAEDVKASTNNGQTGALNWMLTEAGGQGGLFFSGNATSYNSGALPAYNYQAGGTGGYYAVPEPSDLGMMGLGLLMVGLMGLRFRQSRFRRS